MRRLEPQAITQRRQPHAGRGRRAQPAQGFELVGRSRPAFPSGAGAAAYMVELSLADWTVNDRGRRLDHMWATADVAATARSHRVFEDCRIWLKPSDHVPILTEFDL